MDFVLQADTFDIDGNRRSSSDPADPLACNMTFDGWNRLVSAAHAWRDGSNDVQAGQKSVTMSYDGRGV